MMTMFLGPGGYFFGQTEQQVSTLLGSCVALVAWHAAEQLLLVSHVVLPLAPEPDSQDLRYGDAMLSCWLHQLQSRRLQPSQFQLALFGGSTRFFAQQEHRLSVGARNIHTVKEMLRDRGLNLHLEQTGGNQYRKLLVDGRSGRYLCQLLGEPSA